VTDFYVQVESLKVQLNVASREKYQSESTVSRLTGEIDRKVQSRFFHPMVNHRKLLHLSVEVAQWLNSQGL